MHLLHRLKIVIGSLLIIGCTNINASQPHHDNKKDCVSAAAPATLLGVDVVLRIENTVTDYPNGYPIKGAVVKRFKRDGTFTAQATSTQQGQSPDAPQAFYGTYKYQRTGFNTAIEKAIDVSVNNTPYTTRVIEDIHQLERI